MLRSPATRSCGNHSIGRDAQDTVRSVQPKASRRVCSTVPFVCLPGSLQTCPCRHCRHCRPMQTLQTCPCLPLSCVFAFGSRTYQCIRYARKHVCAALCGHSNAWHVLRAACCVQLRSYRPPLRQLPEQAASVLVHASLHVNYRFQVRRAYCSRNV
jgi:hypothetical protein